MVPKWDWKIIPRFTSTPAEIQHKIPKKMMVFTMFVLNVFPSNYDFGVSILSLRGVRTAYIISSSIQETHTWEPVWE